MILRTIEEKDYQAVLDIYNYYIENETVTLEMEPLSPEAFSSRIRQISSAYPYIVCEDEGKVIGYAYLSAFSDRRGYRYTAGFTIYLDKDAKGHGYGSALTREILQRADNLGIRDVIAVITGENQASLAFHQKMGFKEKACFDGVADKFGRRFDVYYYQYKIR